MLTHRLASTWQSKAIALLIVLLIAAFMLVIPGNATTPEAKANADCIGLRTPYKVNQLMYPTMGNPRIIVPGEQFEVEFDPRNWSYDPNPAPDMENFQVYARTSVDYYHDWEKHQLPIKADDQQYGVEKLLPVASVTVGDSTQYPGIPHISNQLVNRNIYRVKVTIPSGLPKDLYDLRVRATFHDGGSTIEDMQPHCLSVVDQYKSNFSVIQLSDIHVFGSDMTYPSSNSKERANRSINGTDRLSQGATYFTKEIEVLNRLKPDFVVFTGDYDFGQAYLTGDKGTGWGNQTQYEYEQEWFYYQCLRLDVPVFICAGNHDSYNDGVDDNLLKNFERLYGPLYHSFDYGPNHFLSMNSTDWSSPDRLLSGYPPPPFSPIIMQPAKYKGAFQGGGDSYAEGMSDPRFDAMRAAEASFSKQLGWARDDLIAHQTSAMRAMIYHHDPYKDGGSGTMWASGTDPIVGNIFDMGNGPGRIAIMELMRHYNVEFELSGHDHSDAYGELAWFDGTGTSKFINTTSASFQADGDSGVFPGYQRVWVNNGHVENASFLAGQHWSYPFYNGTNVGGNTNLHNLSAKAVENSVVSGVMPNANDVTQRIVNHYSFPMVGDNMMNLRFPMPYLSGGQWYVADNGTVAEIADNKDVNPTYRTMQVNINVPQGQQDVRVHPAVVNDTTAPSGDFLINNGDASTGNLVVTLNMNASDAQSGVKDMMVSNDSLFTGAEWEPYQGTKRWTMIAGSPGVRTVYVKYRDKAMPPNVTPTKTDTINYTGGGPVDPEDPQIVSCVPSMAKRGDEGIYLTIDASNTHFAAGQSQANFNPGPPNIGVNSTTVTGSSQVIARVSIDAAATPGTVSSINVVTGAETPYPLANGFRIMDYKPVVTSVDPLSGYPGTAVTVSGDYFGDTQGAYAGHVYFNGLEAPIVSWSMSEIHCTVPPGALSGPVKVTTDSGDADNQPGFMVPGTPAAPHINSISPDNGALGQLVAIAGADFGATKGTSKVWFGAFDVSLAVVSWSSTQIQLVVPALTASNYPVKVTTSTDSNNDKSFTVSASDPENPPVLFSVTPSSGNVGDVVTLAGNGFGATQTTCQVSFNGHLATEFTEWSEMEIKCKVPVGATTGPVVATNGGGPSEGVPFTVLNQPVVQMPVLSTIVPSAGPIGTTVTLTGQYFGALQGTGVVTFNGPPASIINWTDTRIVCNVPEGATTGTVRVTTEAGDSNGLVYMVSDGPVPGQVASRFYFAEGTVRPGFETYICIQNPAETEANVTITYMKGDGTTDGQTLTVPKNARATVRCKDKLGEADDAAHDFSSKVESGGGQPIIVERPMYFNYRGSGNVNWTGGHDVIGALVPAKTWYFAEGTCRPNFDPYFCIQNPGGADAAVTITYMKGNGSTETQELTVKANSRSTVRCKDKLGEANDTAHDFSAKVECTNGEKIIAERPMYFNYMGDKQFNWTGGHDVVGTLAPATTFYFAEGTCRPGFDPYICIQNPNDSDTGVTITYMKGNGATDTQDVAVKANSRSTVRVKDKLGEANDTAHDFSAKVEAAGGGKIIAERPMYFNYHGGGNVNWTGGHDVIGALASAKTFYFAEGTCRPGFDPYICIQNPGDNDADVTITYMKGDGTSDSQVVSVAKKSRSTVRVKDKMGEANDNAHDFSAKVECTNGQTVIAERPMYFQYNGSSALNWTGGHDVVGYTP